VTKTLIVNLGEAGQAKPLAAAMAKLTVDGEAPRDVYAMTVVVDASMGEAANFCLHHIRVLDGQEFQAEESHIISNMSLIIEYEEAL
jgi:hypothetical protein